MWMSDQLLQSQDFEIRNSYFKCLQSHSPLDKKLRAQTDDINQGTILKGKDQYGWPPYTYEFRLTDFW
jgi:hypothetical protein